MTRPYSAPGHHVRTLHAVAREGLAPGAPAKADPRSRMPWNAQQLVLTVAAVAPIGLGLWQGGECWLACRWVRLPA